MSTLNRSIDKIRELLLDPKEQKPSVKQVLGAVLRESQSFYNELSNSNLHWTHEEYTIVTAGGNADYLVTGASKTGRVLFVTAYTSANYPFPVEFADLSEASVNWSWYQPLTAARPEDYNGWGYAPLAVAFYRKDGNLYARLPQSYSAGSTLTITCSTGNWADDRNIEATGVMSGHHLLPEIRAALNLLPGAEWENPESDQLKRNNLASSLMAQESRAAFNFNAAKKSLTADQVTFRDDWT